MNDPLRVGVVGVGHLGRHHARILAGLPGVRLVGVVDSRPEQARSVAEPLGAAALTDPAELLPLVQAVSIAVPTTAHRAAAEPFLDRGIPTLIEKPLAPTPADAEALVSLARRRGAVLQVGHIERFNPAFRTLVDAALRPRFVTAERLGTYTFRSTDISVVLDLMIHDLDLVLGLVDAPVRSVSALGMPLLGELEDVAQARVEFVDGTVADFHASRASYQPARRLRLWGEDGYASVDFATRQATVVRPPAGFRPGAIDWTGVDRGQPAAVRDHLFGQVFRVEKSEAAAIDALTAELTEFVDAARTGRRPTVDGADGLRAVELADAIERQIRARRADHFDHDVPRTGVPAPKFLKRRAASTRPGPRTD